MFEKNEVDKFISGSLGETLLVKYNGSPKSIRFTRQGGKTIRAWIPEEKGTRDGDLFNIESALRHYLRGAPFSINDGFIPVDISDDSQFYDVFKLACNHLNWQDVGKLKITYG